MVFKLDPGVSFPLRQAQETGCAGCGTKSVTPRGFFAKLCSDCPGEAKTFIRLPHQEGTFLYEAAVVNALGKIGLSLPGWLDSEHLDFEGFPDC